jgi:hypothetical protein
MKHNILFLLAGLFVHVSLAQTPSIYQVALPVPETLDSFPVLLSLNWASRTGEQYFLKHDNATVRRRELAGDHWEIDSTAILPVTQTNVAGGACLRTRVYNLEGQGASSRKFEILRTTTNWEQAASVFTRYYSPYPAPGQPYQIADYYTILHRLSDSILYYQITLIGQQGAPNGVEIYRSTNAGNTWQVTNVLGDYKAGDFFALRNGYFLRADNPDFTNASQWPLPDSTLTSNQIRGLFLETDTFYLYTTQNIRWKRTENTSWQADTMPYCWLNSIEQRQHKCYASVSDGLYEVVHHAQNGWTKLLDVSSEYNIFYRNNLAVIDSSDLMFYSSAQGVLHSTDGGVNWVPFHRGLEEQYAFKLGFFGDSLVGQQYYDFLKISAEGRNWRPFNLEGVECSKSNWYPYEQGGYLLTYEQTASRRMQLFYTPDLLQWTPASPLMAYGSLPSLVRKEQRLYLIDYSRVLYSDIAGQQWDTLPLPVLTYNTPYRDWTISGDTFVYVDIKNVCHRTTDFGQNWTILNTPSVAPGTRVDAWKQKGRLLFCTPGGKIWASDDWGDTWEQTCAGLPANPSEPNSYYTMLQDSILGVGRFLTTDAGRHWLEWTGDLVPQTEEALVWNTDWIYFSRYQKGIYRVPAQATLAQLAVLSSLPDEVSVQEKADIPDWSIYPNPVREIIYLTGNLPDHTSFQITDATSRRVGEGELRGTIITIERLPEGVYFLSLRSENQASTRKFLKRK